MDLSNYLLIRTKEKMLLEAKLANKNLVFKDKPFVTDLDLSKMIDELRRDIDENLAKLDRMLSIAKDREEVNDFPVAFVTNLLYILSVNNLHSRLLSPESLQSYLDIIVKKQDFMHLEGIGQCATALEQMAIWDRKVWAALDSQVQKKDTF